ncbi:unnamed protein product [Protopolystoma xenopodis]|uniref:Uncharacterized protein n=1 Tax=Protopolystoma xenopodis TaxID=117903 RepID=A0A448XFP0_9PLAT|nr:unnamed protein product [Protopolystoma xenopodis]
MGALGCEGPMKGDITVDRVYSSEARLNRWATVVVPLGRGPTVAGPTVPGAAVSGASVSRATVAGPRMAGSVAVAAAVMAAMMGWKVLVGMADRFTTARAAGSTTSATTAVRITTTTLGATIATAIATLALFSATFAQRMATLLVATGTADVESGVATLAAPIATACALFPFDTATTTGAAHRAGAHDAGHSRRQLHGGWHHQQRADWTQQAGRIAAKEGRVGGVVVEAGLDRRHGRVAGDHRSGVHRQELFNRQQNHFTGQACGAIM